LGAREQFPVFPLPRLADRERRPGGQCSTWNDAERGGACVL